MGMLSDNSMSATFSEKLSLCPISELRKLFSALHFETDFECAAGIEVRGLVHSSLKLKQPKVLGMKMPPTLASLFEGGMHCWSAKDVGRCCSGRGPDVNDCGFNTWTNQHCNCFGRSVALERT